MWFDIILLIAFYVFLLFQGIFILFPLGTEESTFRRLPWVTFSILAINVIVYFICLPATVQQDRAFQRTLVDLYTYVSDNEQILADEKIRTKLKEIGPFTQQVEAAEEQLKEDPRLLADYKDWLRGPDAAKMRTEIDQKIARYQEAADAHLYNRYGLAGGGHWKAHQFITYAFMHGNTHIGGFVFPFHLFFNLLALFAIGMSLEDLWGRSTFLLFYLAGAVVAAIPEALTSSAGLIGASGAVAAASGAFLVRLPHTKLKIAWLINPFAIPVWILRLMFGQKPWGIVRVKGYFYLAYWIINQLLFSWAIAKQLGASSTSFKTHIAGFLFGAAFAYVLKTTHVEEKHINPKIEAKVSFSASPVVTQALELLDQGHLEIAERKLKAELARNPDDPNTLLALVQVYQRALNYPQVNAIYARLIRYHLAHHDKEAALYAYDALLTALPDGEVNPEIPVRDWLAICEYLRESEMVREAAVEYERLVKSCPNETMVISACVFGGEAALEVHDNARALRLFETAEALQPGSGFASRVMNGLDKARLRMEHRPAWKKEVVKAPDHSTDQEAKDVHF